MNQRRDLHRELINAEQALADVKAQLAHEQANRRRFEAEYRAEAMEAIADVWDEGAHRVLSCSLDEAAWTAQDWATENPYRKDTA